MAKRKRQKSGPRKQARDREDAAPAAGSAGAGSQPVAFTASSEDALEDVSDLELTEPDDGPAEPADEALAPLEPEPGAAARDDGAGRAEPGGPTPPAPADGRATDDAAAREGDGAASAEGADEASGARAGDAAHEADDAQAEPPEDEPAAAAAEAAPRRGLGAILRPSAADVLRAALEDSKEELGKLRRAVQGAEHHREDAERRARALEAELVTETERAANDATELSQAVGEEALERARDRGSAEIRALKRELRVMRLKLEAAIAHGAAREKAVLAEVEERLHRARAETEQITRRSMERILARVEERARIEIQQLTAEVERLRARRGDPREEDAASAARAAGAAVASQAREMAELEEQMRRAVLDAERTALEATRELERVEEAAQRDLEQMREAMHELRRELDEAQVAARLTHKLGEELKRARVDAEALRAELEAARASGPGADRGSPLPPPGAAAAGSAALPDTGAGADAGPLGGPGGGARRPPTGTRLIAALDGPAPAAPPVPVRPPRPHFVKSTQIIEAGKQAVWQDNAKRVAQVSVGQGAQQSKVGRMRQALSAADLDSDPAVQAAADAVAAELEGAPSSGPFAPASAAGDGGAGGSSGALPAARTDFDPDEWGEM